MWLSARCPGVDNKDFKRLHQLEFTVQTQKIKLLGDAEAYNLTICAPATNKLMFQTRFSSDWLEWFWAITWLVSKRENTDNVQSLINDRRR